MNTKCWARIGIRDSNDDRRVYVDISEMRDTINKMRHMISNVIDCVFEKLKEIILKNNVHYRIENNTKVEVLSLGIIDKDLEPPFEKFQEGELGFEEMLKDPAIKEKLAGYFEKAADIKEDIGKYLKQENSSSPFFFVSPVTTRVKNQKIERREVLYLLRNVNNDMHRLLAFLMTPWTESVYKSANLIHWIGGIG
jgi:hypothetical protein